MLIIASLFLLQFNNVYACSTMAGIIPIGPTAPASPNGFPTVTSAMAYINVNGIGGNTILELQDDYTSFYASSNETYPLTFAANVCIDASHTLTIRPASTVPSPIVWTATGSLATVNFTGSSYITIDGRAGGVGSTSYLTIQNTLGTLPAVRLINDATNNTVMYCDLQSNNNGTAASTTGGVVLFGNTTGTIGNDNNTIDHCDIHNVSGGNPIVGINSLGTTTTVAQNNDGNTISNCSIYDMFSATVSTAGIYLGVGNGTWTISGNRLFQTATRTYTSALTHRGIYIVPNTGTLTSASGFVITGNIIGSQNASGTGKMTMNATIALVYNAIDLSVGLGTPTSVQNNMVSNITMTTSSTSISALTGINVAVGNVDIGTTTGNLIGSTTSTTGNHSITFTTTGSLGGVAAIRDVSSGTVNISNNVVAGIDLFGSATTVAPTFNGITATGSVLVSISNNTIGSTTIPNSINLVAASATSTSANGCRGILVNGTTASSTINGNTIANINSNYSGTGTQGNTLTGIAVSAGSSTITNNIIRNLTTSSQTTGTGASSALVGIAYTSTTAPSFISGNEIHTLKSVNGTITSAIQVQGIYYAGPTTGTANSIERNFIHGLGIMNTANSAAVITGLNITSGIVTAKNNMVNLGIDENGNSIVSPCSFKGISESTATSSIYHNSVYIGGTGVGTNAINSFAYQRTAITNADDVRNNIFVNNRSNASSGGKHYSVYLTTSNASLTLDYNIYYGNGNGSVFGFNGTSDAAVYTSSWVAGDNNSVNGDPQFQNPVGTYSTIDMHLNSSVQTPAEQSGILIGAVTDDYDGQTRSGLTPVDIGADAGNYIPLSLCSGTPPAATAALTSSTAICGSGSRTLILSSYVNQPGFVYQWQESSTGTLGSFVDVTSGIGATSNAYTTSLITSSMYYQCIVKCSVSGDSIISSSVQVVVNPSPSLTVTPATGSTVCSGSRVDLVASGANTYTWAVNPGVTGYPLVSLLITPNNLAKVSSVPTINLASSAATPPATVSTPTWIYTVIGTDAVGCTSTSSVTLNVTTSAQVPEKMAVSSSPDPICTTGIPITFTIDNPGVIGTGAWTYSWYDNTGTTLLQTNTNSLSTDSYTTSSPTTNGRYIYMVKINNSVCPSSYAIAYPNAFVGFTSTQNVVNSNCGDNGVVTVYPEGQPDFSTWYSNDFSTGLQGAAYDASYGNSSITGGVCVLNPQALSQNGQFLVRNPGAINTNNLQVDYKVSTYPRGFGASILGGAGYAWSYAADVWQGTLSPSTGGFNAENGSGTGLKLCFDATANGAINTPGAYLMYNCTTPDQGPTSPGVIGFKQGSFWQGLQYVPIKIEINEQGQITVSVNNEIIFDHIQLPASYVNANKSSWIHTFTSRTGASNELHAIDDLNIRYSAYEYSNNSTNGNDGSWQTSNQFTGLSTGTYPIWVRKLSDPTCFAQTGTAVVNVDPSPSSANTIVSTGYSNVVCYGNGTSVTTDIYVPGASFLWEISSSASGPWTAAPGTNNEGTYVTAGLTSNTYFRLTFTCPGSSSVTSTPLLITVNAGSIASTNSPQYIACIGNSVTATAVPGPNTTCVWYTTATGGSPVGFGNSYTATPTTLPVTYYVEPVTTIYSNHYYNGGQTVISNGFGTNTSGSNISTRFTTTSSIVIDSIRVLPTATGTLTVSLQNSGTTTTLSTYTFTVTSTMVGIFTTIPINLTVPGSGNYQLLTSGVACTYYNSYTGTYTSSYMNLGGVFTIVGGANSATGATSTSVYGTAFRIAISSSCPAGSGARIPVLVQADPTSLVTISTASSTMCAGAIQSLSASSPTSYSIYTWTPITDLYTDAAATIPYTIGTNSATVYFKANTSGNKTYIVSTAGSGCTITASTNIDVIAAPSLLVNASPANVCSTGNVQLNANVIPSTYSISSIPFLPLSIPTNVSTVSGDEATQAVTIGFPFGYYGNVYNDLRIHTNGYIQLGSTTTVCTSCYTPPTAPSTATPNNWVGIWSDLNVTAGQVHYGLIGSAPNRKFVVNYNSVNFYSASPSTTHQIILNESDNSIEIHLTSNVTTSTNPRALGIENATGTLASIPTGRNAGTWSATSEAWKFTPVVGTYSYDWTANSIYLSATNIANPIANSLSTPQTYMVQVTDATTGCSAIGNVSVGVNLPSSSSTSVSDCGSYLWNGTTYTASGSYTYTTANSVGCDSISTLNLTLTPCNSILNLTCFVEAYWNGVNAMVPVLANQGEPSTLNACDSIDVELRDATSFALVQNIRTVMNQNGTSTCVFPSVSGNYYIVVKHRSALQTWSANPIAIGSSPATYDFSLAASQAYGSNQVEIASGVWALYSGDIIQDENIDLLDIGECEIDINNFGSGYLTTDLNGDGNVDLLDSTPLEANVANFIFSSHP